MGKISDFYGRRNERTKGWKHDTALLSLKLKPCVCLNPSVIRLLYLQGLSRCLSI